MTEKTLEQKKKLALQLIERLKAAYPKAGCTLDYDDAWKLLVSVRLAAQCTDARVNAVVEKLYEQFPDVAALAAAETKRSKPLSDPADWERAKPETSVHV